MGNMCIVLEIICGKEIFFNCISQKMKKYSKATFYFVSKDAIYSFCLCSIIDIKNKKILLQDMVLLIVLSFLTFYIRFDMLIGRFVSLFNIVDVSLESSLQNLEQVFSK